MRKLAPLFLTLILLLSGCSGEFFLLREAENPYLPVPETSQTPAPLPIPAVGPARSSLFGLAWSPVAKIQPLTDTSRYNQDVYKLVYEPLFSIDGQFEPVPALCTRMTTEDNTVFLLTLRSDARFHDGEPLTPEDVVYSLEQARLPSSPYAQRLTLLRQIRVVEGQVELTLTRPHSRFAALLDIPIVQKSSAGLEVAPGTGPFMFIRETEEDGGLLYLRLSPDWRGAKQPVSRIELTEVQSPEALIEGFELHTISMLSADPFDSTAVNIRANMESWSYATSRLHYIGFNNGRAPFNDANFRRAVSQAIDRESLSFSVFDGYADPSVLPVPPGSRLTVESVTSEYGFDLRVVTLLLETLDFSDEDLDGVLEFTNGRARQNFHAEMLVCSENAAARDAAARIAEDLTKLGLETVCTALPYEDYAAALVSGSFDMYYGIAQVSDDFDPGLFLQGGSLWYGGFRDEPLEAMRNSLRAAPNAASKSERDEFYRRFAERTAIAPVLFTRRRLIAPRGLLTEPTPTDGNLFANWHTWQLSINN